jgi:hypothetical protein
LQKLATSFFLKQLHKLLMITPNKRIDTDYIEKRYNSVPVKKVIAIFENFIEHTPTQLNEFYTILHNHKKENSAYNLSHIITSLQSVGLTIVAIQLQVIEVYINNNNILKAKEMMSIIKVEFEQWLILVKAHLNSLKEESK